MSAHFLDDQRLADLLVQEATEGLTTEEAQELQALLATTPGAAAGALLPAAAAVTLAARLPAEPLPAALRERLVAQGQAAVKAQAAGKVTPLAPRASKPAPVAPMLVSSGSRLGWYAAAASLLLAVAAWWPRLPAEGPRVAEQPVPTLAEQRDTLLAAAQPLAAEWSRTEDPASAEVAGDVVWDEGTQTGYMRFVGLPANDPGEIQYQLWIFDATRDDRYPVDGGVFDVPAGVAEVIVPINATLPVREAALFAVTVERPGGVMVSSRERIVALAQVVAG
jgi:hypothetical protein